MKEGEFLRREEGGKEGEKKNLRRKRFSNFRKSFTFQKTKGGKNSTNGDGGKESLIK